MKRVKFAKTFRNRLSETSYEEWPAGSEDIVSNRIAARAKAKGALAGEPVEVPAEAPDGGQTV